MRRLLEANRTIIFFYFLVLLTVLLFVHLPSTPVHRTQHSDIPTVEELLMAAEGSQIPPEGLVSPMPANNDNQFEEGLRFLDGDSPPRCLKVFVVLVFVRHSLRVKRILLSVV